METVVPRDRRVNISRISVATGMTRKEVSSLLKDPQRKDTRKAASRTRGEQRALRVLRGWLSDPRFQNRSGRAGPLPYRGHSKSFASLVRLYGGDVTPKSVQRELERMGFLETTQTGTLRLRALGKRSSMEAYQLADLARLFEDFAFAIVRPKLTSEAPSFFGFKDSIVPSVSDAAFFMSRFSRRAAALLEDFQQWSAARRLASSMSPGQAGVRVGFGVYLLRSEQSPPPEGANSSADRASGRPERKRPR
jgi:hypothetical protein